MIQDNCDDCEERKMDENTPLLSSTDAADSENPNDAKSETNDDDNEEALSTNEEEKPTTNKEGNQLTSSAAYALKVELACSQMQHQLASRYFTRRQFVFYTIPQAALTMFATILAFVATTELLDENQKTLLNIVVGSTSALVVFLQTLSGISKYESRGAMHSSASDDLSDLRDEVNMILSRIENGLGIVSKNADGVDEEDGIDTIDRITQKFTQSLIGCKSSLPLELTAIWQDALSELNLTHGGPMMEQLTKAYRCPPEFIAKGHWPTIKLKMFNVLSEEVMKSPFFPYFLPNAEVIVKLSMKRLREEVKASSTYWDGFYTGDDESNKRGSLECPTGIDETN